MALGDTVILDNAAVWVGSGATADTNISGYVAQAMLSFQHIETPTPHTFGQAGQVTSISSHYTVTVTLDLITDGYDSGELDKIFQDFMPGPLGAGRRGGFHRYRPHRSVRRFVAGWDGGGPCLHRGDCGVSVGPARRRAKSVKSFVRPAPSPGRATGRRRPPKWRL